MSKLQRGLRASLRDVRARADELGPETPAGWMLRLRQQQLEEACRRAGHGPAEEGACSVCGTRLKRARQPRGQRDLLDL